MNSEIKKIPLGSNVQISIFKNNQWIKINFKVVYTRVDQKGRQWYICVNGKSFRMIRKEHLNEKSVQAY